MTKQLFKLQQVEVPGLPFIPDDMRPKMGGTPEANLAQCWLS